MTSRYQRVILKISGESFCQPGQRGIDVAKMKYAAEQIVQASKLTQVAVVVGGGNFVRGAEISKSGVHSTTGDYMGMLATVINALALQDVLETLGATTRVLSALNVQSVAEPFIRRRAIRHLEKGRVIILAAGTGNPHVTTDTAAALKAVELGAQALFKATTKVDGVYDSDPLKNSSAKRYEKISYLDVINKNLGIMDVTAISMCMNLKLPIIVFNVLKPSNLEGILKGENIGTLISNSNSVLS